jgi:hypothetical protein
MPLKCLLLIAGGLILSLTTVTAADDARLLSPLIITP